MGLFWATDAGRERARTAGRACCCIGRRTGRKRWFARHVRELFGGQIVQKNLAKALELLVQRSALVLIAEGTADSIPYQFRQVCHTSGKFFGAADCRRGGLQKSVQKRLDLRFPLQASSQGLLAASCAKPRRQTMLTADIPAELHIIGQD